MSTVSHRTAHRQTDPGHRPRLQARLASVRRRTSARSIIGALVVGVLSILTLGILAGPLAAGLYGMVVKRVRDGQQPEVGDVFGQMSRFWSFFAAALVLVILIGLASLTIIGGILLATIWLYVFPLMVDRGMGLGEAMSTSYRMVKQAGFWEHLALVIVFVVISSVAERRPGDPGHAVPRRGGRRRLLSRGRPGRGAGARGRLTPRAGRRLSRTKDGPGEARSASPGPSTRHARAQDASSSASSNWLAYRS